MLHDIPTMKTFSTRRLVFALLLPFCLLVTTGEVHSEVFYVSAKGNDTWRGKRNAPFATLGRAQKAASQRIGYGLREDLWIVIGDGTYELTESLQFGPEDGGTAEFKVVYTAEQGASPLISGGWQVRDWRTDAGDRWIAPVPSDVAQRLSFREFFVDGQRRPRARYPGTGYLRVERAGGDRRTSFYFKEGDIPFDFSADGVEVVFLHDWSTSRVKLREIDSIHRELKYENRIGCAAEHYAIDHFEPHPRYFLEGIQHGSIPPGQWYFDRERLFLVYHPLEGETLEQFHARPPVLPNCGPLLRVTGGRTKPIRNLHFIGLRFEFAEWPLPDLGFAAGQATSYETRQTSDHDGRRRFSPAALYFENAKECSVGRCAIAHLGMSGIWIGSRCDDCELSDCRIYDVSGNGVMLGEETNRLILGKPWWESQPHQVASRNIVRNNLIEQCGQQFFGAVGLWIGFARDSLITQNEIRDLPYTGLSIGWKWDPTPTPCRDNKIVDNHIHDVLKVLSDGGAIYSLGRQPGTVFAGNIIHDIAANKGRAESNGIFMDEGSSEIEVRDNIIFNVKRSPIRFHRAEENLVRDNFLVSEPDVPTFRYNRTNEDVIDKRDNQIVVSKGWIPSTSDSYAGRMQQVLKSVGPRDETAAKPQ